MFRTQQNAFDEAVVKATDENFTSENWAFIMDVCDRTTTEETGPKDVVAAMIKRLAHRNANVQLYTLELANALSENCGPKVNRELASRSFTDALLRLASDRNTHQQVKARILERMGKWAETFSEDPDLGIMEQAYTKLRSQNPNLQPPSKPTKRPTTDLDRQKEDEELQMALLLSVKEKASAASAPTQKPEQAPAGQPATAQPAPVTQSVPSGTTPATVSRVRALYDFQPSEPGELQFKKGDVITVIESVYKDWWKGLLRGQTGIFPLNYVEKLADPTQEEMQREAQMEAEVFAEIKNVEKLLTLLSMSNVDMNVRDNDEITNLYHSTLAIRPKLIELIGKYTQRKEDFTQLNERFIKAKRDYESLLEASLSQPSHTAFGQRPGQPYSYPGGYAPHGPQQPHDPSARYQSPVQDSRIPQSQYPPQSTQTPFYTASQTPQPLSSQLQQPYTTLAHRQRTPSGGRPGAPITETYASRPTQPPIDPYAAHPPVTDPYAPPSTIRTGAPPANAYVPPTDSYAPPGTRPPATGDPYAIPQELSSGTAPYSPPSQTPGPYPPNLHTQHPPLGQSNDYSPSLYSPSENPHSPPPQFPHLNPPYQAYNAAGTGRGDYGGGRGGAGGSDYSTTGAGRGDYGGGRGDYAPPAPQSAAPGPPGLGYGPGAAQSGYGGGAYQAYKPATASYGSGPGTTPGDFYRG